MTETLYLPLENLVTRQMVYSPEKVAGFKEAFAEGRFVHPVKVKIYDGPDGAIFELGEGNNRCRALFEMGEYGVDAVEGFQQYTLGGDRLKPIAELEADDGVRH